MLLSHRSSSGTSPNLALLALLATVPACTPAPAEFPYPSVREPMPTSYELEYRGSTALRVAEQYLMCSPSLADYARELFQGQGHRLTYAAVHGFEDYCRQHNLPHSNYQFTSASTAPRGEEYAWQHTIYLPAELVERRPALFLGLLIETLRLQKRESSLPDGPAGPGLSPAEAGEVRQHLNQIAQVLSHHPEETHRAHYQAMLQAMEGELKELTRTR